MTYSDLTLTLNGQSLRPVMLIFNASNSPRSSWLSHDISIPSGKVTVCYRKSLFE